MQGLLSPTVCLGFLQEFWFRPTTQRQVWLINNAKLFIAWHTLFYPLWILLCQFNVYCVIILVRHTD